VREAISNSYDAKASQIKLSFDVPSVEGEDVLRISMEDNGEGMGEEQVRAFFDLGNSPRRGQKNDDPSIIGEKGHGTKVYFNSAQIHVRTCMGYGADEFEAEVTKPLAALHGGALPRVRIHKRKPAEDWHGTHIEVLGYNNSRREMFGHDEVKDYVLWSTRFGSLQQELTGRPDETVLFLKGLGAQEEERMQAGHVFPTPSAAVKELFDEHFTRAPDHYARRWTRHGTLPRYPDIHYSASFWVEGESVKRQYNPMLRGHGKPRRHGDYTVQERYGLWLCKDFIPIERRNDWMGAKGSEYTKFHAFFNCQRLRLTANRGTASNTPTEILADVESVCRALYSHVVSSQEWSELEWLEEESAGYESQQKERQNLETRLRHIQKAKRAEYKGHQFLEPRQEAGVYSLFLVLSALEPDLSPFAVLDYDTHQGIDVIADPGGDASPAQPGHRFVEFKYSLGAGFNHSFDNLHAVVCWQLEKQIGEEISDPVGSRRLLERAAPAGGGLTKYFLNDSRSPSKIEVILLKEYVWEKLGIEFVAP
jgi:hypothetical protein